MNEPTQRDHTLDTVRGLIVCLMALDHVRIFFSSAQFEPTDLSATTSAYFLTRWITHLCAPGFFFIAGLSAALMENRAPSKRTVAQFLLIRGFWLIALELFVFGFAWSFNFAWHWLGVIWGLGSAMTALAGLLYLPRKVLLIAALLFTLLHDFCWPMIAQSLAMNDVLIYKPGFIEWPLFGKVLVIYPLLPWLALMVLGYASQPWIMPERRLHKSRLLTVAITLIVPFIAIRTLGIAQPSWMLLDTTPAQYHFVLSLLNVEKYPPSLQFSMITLAVLALAAALLLTIKPNRLSAILTTFGQVPFFFYLSHLFLIHGAALAIAMGLNWPQDYLFWRGAGPNLTPPNGYGFELFGVYLVWIMVLLLLYPACRWFTQHKKNSSSLWMRLL